MTTALKELLELEDKGISVAKNIFAKTIREIILKTGLSYDALLILIEAHARDPANGIIIPNRQKAFCYNTQLRLLSNQCSYPKFLEFLKILGINELSISVIAGDDTITNTVRMA